MLEVLSPAGSPEAVFAAVQNGADAVYLGFDGLTGSREAVNFSDDAFERAVRYCRVRGCKVYLAMDILINDRETARAGGLALRAQRAGVDAVILRDLGLYRILRQLLPEMPLFAAAELGFRTPEDAAIAARLGFSRIFLPPELPLQEAARLRESGVETAVLVQGSVCAAESGQCALSVLSGRDSADRGLCARPCREKYSLGGRWDTTPLRYKDRCLLRVLDRLEQAGVTCALIGGREQRPEYSAAFTALYDRAVKEGKLPAAPDLARLESLYSREGFSTAAERAGEPPEELNPREAERLRTQQRKTYAAGTEVRRVPVEFAVVARSDHARIRLGVVDEQGNKTVMDGPVPVCYGEIPIVDSALREAMYKTAGTPYHCTDVRAAAQEGLTLSRADLDVARRELLDKLSEERAKPPVRREGEFPPTPPARAAHAEPVINFSFRTPEQMTPELAALEPACVYAPLELLAERPEVLAPFLEKKCVPVAVLPPAVCGQEEEQQLTALLERAKAAGVYQVLAPGLGLALRALQQGLSIRGGAALGVFNGYTLQNLASAGFLSATLSPQLSLQQVREMPKPLNAELLVYGRLPAMVTGQCLMKASAGRCTCATPGQLADTHGGVWPVVREFGCRNTVYAARKLFLADRPEDWKSCGAWAVRLAFSTESPRECLEVARCYMQGSVYRPNGLTHGACYRGVQ